MEPEADPASVRRCTGQTLTGGECKHKVREGETRCWVHKGPQCPVCFVPMTHARTRALPCGHEFHERCIERWKSTCTGPDPTCPMCREPFDVPTYRCRLIIERAADGQRTTTDFESNNVASIVQGFGLDFRNLIPNGTGRFYTDIHFDIDPNEALADILRELGLPNVHFD